MYRLPCVLQSCKVSCEIAIYRSKENKDIIKGIFVNHFEDKKVAGGTIKISDYFMWRGLYFVRTLLLLVSER
jgi:hypothetical protein